MTRAQRLAVIGIIAVLTLAVSAFAVGCGGGDDGGNGGGNGGGPAATEPAGNGDNGDDGEPAQEIVISARDNYFEPDTFSIPAGQKVRITMKNEGTAIHMMRLKTQEVAGREFMTDVIVNGGDESSFDVRIDEPGTYDFVCDYHVPDMVGTFTVE